MEPNCPCKKKSCPRHGSCAECRAHHAAFRAHHAAFRAHHAASERRRHVFCERSISIRPFRKKDAKAVSALICRTLRVSNAADYPPEYIEESIRRHTPEAILEQAKDAHFYVAVRRRKIIGCGGISGYWGSETESWIFSVFILPEHQWLNIGRRIMNALEQDEYFCRAWRTELGASLTAVEFYRKLGYSFRDGISEPDKYGVIRMEKQNPQG